MYAPQVVLRQRLERRQVLSNCSKAVKHSFEDAPLPWRRRREGAEEGVELGVGGAEGVVAGDEGATEVGVGAGEKVGKEDVEDDEGGSSLQRKV